MLARLVTWSVPWRERWGRLANELADGGTPFPEDELQAFDQVERERRDGRNLMVLADVVEAPKPTQRQEVLI